MGRSENTVDLASDNVYAFPAKARFTGPIDSRPADESPPSRRDGELLVLRDPATIPVLPASFFDLSALRAQHHQEP